MTENILELIGTATDYVRERLEGRKPEAGIILGSGLGRLADLIEDPVTIPYSSVPDFPVSTAIGHKGNFICGNFAGRCVMAMQGRFHFYEGYPMELVTLPVRVLVSLGIKVLIASNAAGSTNRSPFKCGDIMFITDHISLMPNPLIGVNLEVFGPRFPDMTHAYDKALLDKALRISGELGTEVRTGVYLAVSGPSYETPAEYRFFRLIGADAVGMSTVPEICVARQSGIPCLGVSVITDVAHEIDDDYVTDENEIVAAADAASDRLNAIIERFISEL